VDEIVHIVLDSKNAPLKADKIIHSDTSINMEAMNLKQLPVKMLSARESLSDIAISDITEETIVVDGIKTKIP
jgi:hypothetical protein